MRALIASSLAACSFTHGALGSDGSGPSGDTQLADHATAIDADPRCFGSQGPSGYYFCAATVPTAPIVLGGTVSSDTCSGGGMKLMLHAPDGTQEQVCAYVGAGVMVTMTFTVTGGLPLVIASTQDVTITGTVDVSTISGAQHGAGHNSSLCDYTGVDGKNDNNGGSGGAGGSFGTAGGNGGNGGNGATGGVAAPTANPTSLRGGCRSGGGGNGNGGNGGTQGWSGGAVYVVADGTIDVSGAINASGERGYGGAGRLGGGAGGSGGGSGGMILLDAQTLTVEATGRLVANGGGGGGGGDSGIGDGQNGTNPDPAMPQTPAAGGNGNGAGGNGNDGAAGTTAAIPGADAHQAQGGGGGGGGGEGVIQVISGGVPAASNNISPAARS